MIKAGMEYTGKKYFKRHLSYFFHNVASCVIYQRFLVRYMFAVSILTEAYSMFVDLIELIEIVMKYV